MNEHLEWDELYDWNDDNEEPEVFKDLEAVSCGDLFGDEYDIWMQRKSKYAYEVELINEDGDTVAKEDIAPIALENFARFCRSFLTSYSRYENKE